MIDLALPSLDEDDDFSTETRPKLPKPKPTPQPQSLELALAQRANDAIGKGADGQQAIGRLHQMISYLRSNPDAGKSAQDALGRGVHIEDIERRTWDLAQQPSTSTPADESESRPPFLTRLGQGIRATAHEFREHPLESLGHIATAPVKAFGNMIAPTEAEAAKMNEPDSMMQQALTARFGQPIPQRGVDMRTRAIGTAQTLANVVAPGLGPLLGGAITGAAYAPDDPFVGATIGTLAGGATKLTGGAVSAGIRKSLTPAEIARGRVLSALKQSGMTPSDVETRVAASPDKPLTMLDVGGKPMMRLARTARAASPAADETISNALTERNAGAADRAINDALQATGLVQRSSAFQTAEKFLEERANEATANYGPVFADKAPLSDPRLTEILSTPAGKEAVARAGKMMGNKRLPIQTAQGDVPLVMDGKPIMSGAQLEMVEGKPVTTGGTPVMIPGTVPTPTIQQLHYIKLALDDIMGRGSSSRGIERGPAAGGIGYNEALSVRDVQRELLNVMDEKSPAYAQARQQFADKSALIRANDLGRQLFKMQPEEAAAELADLSTPAEQSMFRRAGMDALADRLENGPQDVSHGVSKPRDLRRLRLLFPDDASFTRFRNAVTSEAEMVRTGQAITGGSQTADKLVDLASMLDASSGRIVNAALSGPGALVRFGLGAAAQAARMRMSRAIGDVLAPDLTAGATGDFAKRAAVIQALKELHAREPVDVAHAAIAAAHHAANAGSQAGVMLPDAMTGTSNPPGSDYLRALYQRRRP